MKRTREEWAWLALPFLAAVAAYLPSVIRGAFVWDDVVYLARWIETSPSYREVFLPERSVMVSTFFKPLPGAIQLTLFKLFGGHASGWRAGALLLHLIAVSGVLALFRRWTLCAGDAIDAGSAAARERLAIAGAALFALFPTNVDTVCWVSAHADTLLGIFATWGVVLHLRSRDDGTTTIPAAALFLLALFSKETAVAIPPIAMAASVLLPRKDGTSVPFRSALHPRIWLPYVGAFAAYTALRHAAMGPGKGLGGEAGSRLVMETVGPAIRAFGFYVRGLLLVERAPYVANVPEAREVWPFVVIGAGALAAALLAAFRPATRGYSLAAIWIVCFLGPPMAIANNPPTVTPVALRYLYGPAIGWCAAIALALRAIPAVRMRHAAIAGAIVLVLLGIDVERRARPWESNAALWTRGMSDNPADCLPLLNLGNVRLLGNDLEGAESLYRRASYSCETAAPEIRAEALSALAKYYMLRKQYDLAVVALREAENLPGTKGAVATRAAVETLALLARAPKGPGGTVIVSRAQLIASAESLEHAAEDDPLAQSPRLVLASVDELLGEPVRARRFVLELLRPKVTTSPEFRDQVRAQADRLAAVARNEPDPVKHAYFEAELAEEDGRTDDAIAAYRTALNLAPDRVDIMVPLGLLLAGNGKLDEGVELLERAVKTDERDPTAWFDLGVCYGIRKDFAKAADAFSQAGTLEPRWSKPWLNAGLAREQAHDLVGARDAYRAFLSRPSGSYEARDFAVSRVMILNSRIAQGAGSPAPK